MLITDMHSSRMHRLVIVTVRMADTILQNAYSHAMPMKQGPVKAVCLMLCLTLDGGVRIIVVYHHNPFTVMSHKTFSCSVQGDTVVFSLSTYVFLILYFNQSGICRV